MSAQVNAIQDNTLSQELRTKLLYNILEVSSENPGKLISDYQKSDHPLMDALDKSVKLGAAVERLARLPGLSRVAKILDRKAQRIITKQTILAASKLP